MRTTPAPTNGTSWLDGACDSFVAGMPSQFERLTWSADRLLVHQHEQLQRLLTAAIEASAFHRARLSGIDPKAVILDDLATVPVMTKSDMMRSFDAVVTDPRLTREVVASSCTRATPSCHMSRQCSEQGWPPSRRSSGGHRRCASRSRWWPRRPLSMRQARPLVRTALLRHPTIREHQTVVGPQGLTIRVAAEGSVDTDSAASDVASNLSAAGAASAVEVVVVDAIQRDACTGKVQHTVRM